MTNEEAMKNDMGINNSIYKISQEVKQDLEQKVCLMVQQYADEHELHDVYTINPKLICEALKKQIPKKPWLSPSSDYDDHQRRWQCSECGCTVGEVEEKEHWNLHCFFCGQAIDWSET